MSLQDFRGKWVVLYFYPKDFTSGCPDGKIAHVFDDVKPAEHSTQVLATLTELEKK